MSVKGSGSTDWTDVESKGFVSVVSWLDEQMQTWLPLCESSLLTTATKIQFEVFLPVYIQSCVLAAGIWIWTSNSTTICFTWHPSVLFWFYAYTSIIWQMKKRKIVCLVVNDKLYQCRPIVRQLSWNQLLQSATLQMSENYHVWWCSVCTYIFLTVINRYIFTNLWCVAGLLISIKREQATFIFWQILGRYFIKKYNNFITNGF